MGLFNWHFTYLRSVRKQFQILCRTINFVIFKIYFTVSVFYMLLQALLDYERHTTKGGELNVPITPHAEPINIENQVTFNCVYNVSRAII